MTTRTLCTLATAAALVLPACSSSEKVDQWYNTDAGLGFNPPDGGSRADLAPDAKDAPSDQTAAVGDATSVDGSSDSIVESSVDSSDGESG